VPPHRRLQPALIVGDEGNESLITGHPGASETPAAKPAMASPARTNAQPATSAPASEPATCNLQLATEANTAHSDSEFKVQSSMFDVRCSGPVHHSITPVPPERCHECRALLPPLLPSGERPSPYCNKCDTPLRPPGSLIEYCPKCRHVLQELNANGTRPTPECLYCNKTLPPPP